jgi:hypothetical protein
VVVAGVFRLAKPDGSPILVTGKTGAMARIQTVLPPDWQIGEPVPWQRNPPRKTESGTCARARESAAAPVLVAHPVQAPAPPVAAKRQPFTLVGKNSEVAATLLEYRMRRWR